MKVRLYEPDDSISDELFEISGEKDFRGNFAVEKQSKKLFMHPSRLLSCAPTGNFVTRRSDQALFVSCPKCFKTITVGPSNTAECSDHGQFNLDWSNVLGGPLQPQAYKEHTIPQTKSKKRQSSPRTNAIPESIDFRAILKVGRLWSKKVEFDHNAYSVQAHAFIIDSGRPRKWCFNSYNGTWGKKSKAEHLTCFIQDKKLNDSMVGFVINGEVSLEEAKLGRAGYSKTS